MLVSSFALLGAATVATAAESASESARSLQIPLMIAPALPAASRVPLLREATRIWQSQGVTIDWLPSTAQVEENRSLRVLVLLTHGSAGGDSLAVGELIGSRRGQAVAIVSIEAAERLVAKSWPQGFPAPSNPDPRRLGLVLGRAIAHEIGHYLLDTGTHARYGLMRPSFDAREFADLRPGPFMLDAHAAQWLRGHFPPRGPAVQVAEVPGFSYSH